MAGRIGLELSQTHFASPPGGLAARATAVVRNTGRLVEHVSLRVDGLDPAWWCVSPADASLLPDDAIEMQLQVRPPADAPAGHHPFRVVAVCTDDPSEVAEVAADLEVAEAGAIELSLLPSRQHRVRSATYAVRLWNRSNTHRLLRVAASDPDEVLGFDLPTDQVLLQPGQETQLRLRARARHTAWFGPEQTFPFSVEAMPPDEALAPFGRVDGELVRRSLLGALAGLPAGLRRAALVAAPLLLALALGVWFLARPGPPGPISPVPPTKAPTGGPVAVGPTAPPAGTGAGADEQAATSAVAPPVIVRFGLDLPADDAPAFLPLDVDVRDADAVEVTRSPQDTGPSRAFADMETADYTLTASNAGGSISESLRVYVLRPPVITQFEASAVQVGDTVRLTWRTDRANRVYLNETLLADAEGSTVLPYNPNGAYVLRAENTVGQDSRVLEVSPDPAPAPTPTETPTPTPTPGAADSTPTDGPTPGTPGPAATSPPTPPTSPPAPTDTPTPATPPPTPTDTPTPATPPPTPTDTPTDTPTPVPSTPPTAPNTPTATATPTPQCAKLESPKLTATTSGNDVSVAWSASGGCAPYTGDVKAVYTYNNSDRTFEASSPTGSAKDTPPAGGCGSPNTVNYSWSLKDNVGQTVSANASASLAHECPTKPPPRPAIAGAQAPAANANGWNNTDVTVTFTCSDPNYAITSCGPSPVGVTSEGKDQPVTGTVVDDQGAKASATVGVSIDKTAPTISATRAPDPNADGWNNTDVTLTFSCADALSGVDTCGPSPQVLSKEGANQSASAAAADLAGNSATANVAGINIDKTPPTISAVVSPTPNAAGWIGRRALPPADGPTSPTVTLTATDALSGVKSITFSAAPACTGCGGQTIAQTTTTGASVTIPINAEGQTTIAFLATDKADNSSAPQTVTVKLDLAPPRLTTSISPAPVNGVIRSLPVVVTVTATDPQPGSGVASVTARGAPAQCGDCNQGPAIPAVTAKGDSVQLTINANGQVDIIGSASDVADNATGDVVLTTVNVAQPVLSVDLAPVPQQPAPQPGSVSASPAGTPQSGTNGLTNCQSFCAATYNANTSVQLTAKPNPGWVVQSFVQQIGSNSTTVCQQNPPLKTAPVTCTVNVGTNDSVRVTANFIQIVTLTIQKPGDGAGTVTGNVGPINCGSTCSASFTFPFKGNVTVTLTANPASGSDFGGWASTQGTPLPDSCKPQPVPVSRTPTTVPQFGGVTPPPTSCTITISVDTTITATFRQLPPPPR